jgi:hypothetical protein
VVRRRSLRAGLAIFAASAACAGCREAQPVTRVEERPALLRAMNPFVLTNLVSSKMTVEVDWIAGDPPSAAALETLQAALEEQCEAGKRIRIVRDDEIPRADWQAAQGRPGLEALVARSLDGDPAAWEEEELLYVLYAPASGSWYGQDVTGMTDTVIFEREGTVLTARVVLLFTERIRREALLWIDTAKIETATIVHELGHVLGLVANPRHAHEDDEVHCTRSRCVMARPGARTMFVNALPAFFAASIPHDFGEECRADIAAARRMWAAMAREHPAFAGTLREERRKREARAIDAWKSARP